MIGSNTLKFWTMKSLSKEMENMYHLGATSSNVMIYDLEYRVGGIKVLANSKIWNCIFKNKFIIEQSGWGKILLTYGRSMPPLVYTGSGIHFLVVESLGLLRIPGFSYFYLQSSPCSLPPWSTLNQTLTSWAALRTPFKGTQCFPGMAPLFCAVTWVEERTG